MSKKEGYQANHVELFSQGMKLGTVLLISCFLGACMSSIQNMTQGNGNSLPNWVNNPGDGVVGSCGMHVKGRSFQEECARQRAREQLAARNGVSISSVTMMEESVTNATGRVKYDKQTVAEVEKTTVKAKVTKQHYDPVRDQFYVLMVSE